MEIPQGTSTPAGKKYDYSVWAIPPEDVGARLKRLMAGLTSEFGGPQFEPHVTVVGAISLTEQDALEKFNSACDGLQAYKLIAWLRGLSFISVFICYFIQCLRWWKLVHIVLDILGIRVLLVSSMPSSIHLFHL
ncbi:CYCLIC PHOSPHODIESTERASE-LIKE [Salix purpurea]|uniref:CYCLIC PHOSPHODIESTERASE-LIKE n=1 Tax=Salix purpurea TaxID=77065 RepID=A0A9Q1AG72_SALPP|nr:CYCLIC PHOSPHODIESTERASE-LIKE [Salix purpurea]